MVKVKTRITDQGVIQEKVIDSEDNNLVINVPIIVSGSSVPLPGLIRGQFVYQIGGTLATGSDQAPRLSPSGPFRITNVRIECKTAPTGGSGITVDINSGGTTIFTTQANRPNIPTLGLTGTSGTPNTTDLDLNTQLTCDIDTVGSTTPGSDLTIMVRGYLL